MKNEIQVQKYKSLNRASDRGFNRKLLQDLVIVEKTILGTMLIDPASIDDFVAICGNHNLFLYPKHNQIFDAILNLIQNADGKVDILTVAIEARRLGFEELIYYISDLTTRVTSSSNFKTHLELLRQMWAQVALTLQIGELITDFAREPSLPAELIEAVTIAMIDVDHRHLANRNIDSFNLLAQEWYRSENMPSVVLNTGHQAFDRISTGICSGQLITVAAKTGYGKTTFALNLARWVASKPKQNVLVFSLEMSKREVMQRILSQESKVPMRVTALQRHPEYDEQKRLDEATDLLKDPARYSQILIDDSRSLTPTACMITARGLIRKHKIKLIVIDYLHLMQDDDERGRVDEQSRLSEITRKLKAIAGDLNIPIVVLSQLNKSATEDPDLDALRGSGMIANNSDKVLFLCQPPENPRDGDVEGFNQLRVKFAKNRQGPRGDAYFDWDRPTNRLDFPYLSESSDYQTSEF